MTGTRQSRVILPHWHTPRYTELHYAHITQKRSRDNHSQASRMEVYLLSTSRTLVGA